MSALLAVAPVIEDPAFTAPVIEYADLAPILVILVAAVIGVLVEAFAPAWARRTLQLAVAFGAIVVAFGTVVINASTRLIAAQGSVAVDGPALFLQGTVLLLAFCGLLLFAEREVDPAGDAFAPRATSLPGSAEERDLAVKQVTQTEVYPLAMFALAGMVLFPAANDLLTMFVALEVLSLPLYLLAGMARRRRLLSQEASLKYFLLGAFSSAFFLYGAALLYGFSGTISISGIGLAAGATVGRDPLLLFGVALVAVGLLFKVGAAPFHQWTPDVYQGAPTAVTAFMAACTKVAAFGALLRVFYVALGPVRWDWRPMMWGIAILTMLVGSIIAITQTDIKRMLAYSAIAHTGFLLVGVLAVSAEGISSTMFYLLAYGATTIAAFALVTLVRSGSGEASHLSQWAGLGKRSPLVAGLFAYYLLSLAGIPLTSGFTAKFSVFSAAVAADATPLVIVGVIASAIAAFFYVRVIVLMFFADPAPDGPTVAIPSGMTVSAISIVTVISVVLGLFPQPFLDLAEQAGVFLR